MSEKTDHLVNRLTVEGQKVLDFFRSLDDASWQHDLYADGQSWTLRTMFTHLVEAEGSLLVLLQSITEGSPGMPEDFDIDRWNKSKMAKMTDLAPPDLLKMYEERRARTIEWVKTLTDEQLQIEGRQIAVGKQPLETLIKVFYHHGKLHLLDARKSLGTSE